MKFDGMSVEAAREFASYWLPAWTGNDPGRLTAFYTDDAFYADPGVPQGLTGKEALRAYFSKLLARYPDWVWTQERAVPLEHGFLNFWKADIPEKGRVITLRGVCMVQLRDGKIARNEVFFDRLPWMS